MLTHAVFFIDRKFVYLYSYIVGWFPQKTILTNSRSPSAKRERWIFMSIENWLQEIGADVDMNEYGEVETQVEAEPDTDAEEYEPEDAYEEEVEYEDEPVEEEHEEEPRKQTREENAYYAERRRQEQIDKAVQERLRQTKEYQTTKLISEMYGVPEEQLYDQLYEAKLAKEAQSQNVPVEYLREREELRKQQQQLQDQLHTIMFQQWQSRIDTEKVNLKAQFNMLSDADLESAAYYMLNDLKRTDLPLENAVFALHGAKILGGLKNTAKNEALAEVSGRKKSPLPVKGGKSESAVSLSDEERYVAKKLGLTDKDYAKWKEG
jgi:hypothetical protein